MTAILLQTFTFVLIIASGYFLKRVGFFAPKDYQIIAKVVLNITMPATIVTGFAGINVHISFLFVLLFGLGCNLVMVLVGFWVSRKKIDSTKALYMLNFSGYNIGSFTLPYVQSFLGSYGVVVISMFDMGNSILSTGGTYAVTSMVVKSSKQKGIYGVFRKLFSSVPFDTYLLMLILTMIQVDLPSSVHTVLTTVAAANSFLAMLMIGMMFEIKLELKFYKQVLLILLARYSSATIFALLIYFFSPFSLEIRQVLSIVVFAPISSLTPAFTEKCKGNGSLSSLANSISIVISTVIITVLILVMSL